MGRKSIYLILILALLFSTIGGVYADDSTDLKEEQEEINEKREEVSEELKEKEEDLKTLNRKINLFEKKLKEKEKEIEDAKNKINKLNKNIEQTEKDLKEAEKKIEKKDQNYKARLKAMYENGTTVSYIEVLLSSEDIVSFLSRLDIIERIIEQDKSLMEYMKEQREIIEKKRKELNAQKKSLYLAEQKLNREKKNLETAARKLEVARAKASKDKKALEKREDELNRQAQILSNKIRGLQSGGEYQYADSSDGMSWPVPGYTSISSPFGYRIHPILGVPKLHTGIDIPAPYGQEVKAVGDGVVKIAGWLSGYGYTVLIDHGGGIMSLYAHNSKLYVRQGESVRQGQTVSNIGTSGYSTGPHLHFEIRKNGDYVDPVPYVRH